MKITKKGAISIAIAAVLIIGSLLPQLFAPEGHVPLRDIISSCSGDAENNGSSVFLAITGEGRIDSGERHGQRLLVCDASAGTDIEKVGYIPPEKVRQSIDLTDLMPINIQLGDINGDGLLEISICAYNAAELTKYPVFYHLSNKNLTPVHYDSGPSPALDCYMLLDMNSDGIDELAAIEFPESGQSLLSVYGWQNNGLELLAQSELFDGELRFDLSDETRPGDGRDVFIVQVDGKKIKSLIFHLEIGALIGTVRED